MTEPDQSEETDDDRRAICFVLLPSREEFAINTVAEQIRRDFGVDAEIVTKEQRSAASFQTAAGKAMLTQSDSAIPNDEASHAASGNVFWKDGPQEADKHESYLVVMASCPGDEIDVMIFLTSIVRTVLDATDAIGVYWSKGKIANSKAFFLKSSAKVTRTSLPLHLWVRFQLVRNEDGLKAYTIGMKQFRHQEIHTTRCGWKTNELVGCVYDAAHYIVSNNVILTERDTLGRTEKDKLEIRFVPNPFQPEERVTQIQLT